MLKITNEILEACYQKMGFEPKRLKSGQKKELNKIIYKKLMK